MAKNKFYAIKKGKNTGIFDSWTECEKNVKGFLGAIYKGFPTLGEAEEWLNKSNDKKTIETIVESNYEAIAYVDGSYNDKSKIFTYGLVFLYNDKILTYKEKFNNSKWAKARNVAGEIMGVVKAIQVANEGNINSLLIYHDLDGLGHWARGEWKTNTPETIAYKNFIDENKAELKLEFVSIKGHSGIKYNEKSDELANEAYSLKDFSPVLFDSNFVYIDRNLIDTYLKTLLSEKYTDKYDLTIEEENETIKKIRISTKTKSVVMNFNIKPSGAMTIGFNGDKKLGFEIKKELEDKYFETSPTPNSCFSLKIPTECIIEFKSKISGLEDIKLIIKEVSNANILESFLIQNKNNKITCTIFKNGSLLVQGKSSLLMAEIVLLLSENYSLNTEDIVKMSNRIYEKNTSASQVKEELKKLTPNSYNKLDPIIKNYLICSVSNSYTEKQLPDYSDVCFQALKALEGQLSEILNSFENLPKRRDGHYDFSQIFENDKKLDKFKMKKKYKEIIVCEKKRAILEDIYNFFKKERHTAFHTDPILSQTRIISTIEEAKDIILTCIKLIDKSFL